MFGVKQQMIFSSFFFQIFQLVIFLSQQGLQYASLPPLLFSGAAILAAVSILFSPETFRKKLPDTIDEAINL